MIASPDRPRIVHLGIGNFHRAHQAWYTANAGGWTITGVAMSNTALRDQLAVRENAYTLATRGQSGLTTETIRVYGKVLVAKEKPNLVIEEIASPNTKIVTLTITEKGYYLKPESAELDLDDSTLKQDFDADTPQTAIGILAHGLALRAQTCAGPITVLSCDNISENGRKLGQAITQFCQTKQLNLDDWLTDNVRFPDCMVDRITPASSPEILDEIASHTGHADPTAVLTEDFSEWVIEDAFANDRPAWETAGALIVQTVLPFEKRKLRLLNASHSFLAYAGILRGHRYVHEAIDDPVLKNGVERLWQEAITTLPEEVQRDAAEYCQALLDRYGVPEMRHELRQIAMDGSLKLRERLVPILLQRVENHEPVDQTLSAIAHWVCFLSKEHKSNHVLQDANAEQLGILMNAQLSQAELCARICELIGLPGSLTSQLGQIVKSIED